MSKQIDELMTALAKIEQLERENAELRNELQVMVNRNHRLWSQIESRLSNNDNPDDYVMQH
jgi:cell shape-determining protein MreC